MQLLLFVLKLMASSGILLGYYWLALRNRNFHRYNRFYLLAAVATSLVMPFISIDFLVPAQEPAGKLLLQTFDVITVDDAAAATENTTIAASGIFSSMNFWLATAYAAGTLFMGILLFRSASYIQRLRRRYPLQELQDLRFYLTTEPGTPFSFFKSIFWNNHIAVNSTEGQQIFRHELYHVKQQHSADLLFMELVLLLAWFNPFYYLIRRELKVIHEFLADEHAASGGDEYAYAELLVLFALQEKQQQLVHPFFHHSIKRRITMLTRINKQKMGYWGRIMALPLSLFLFSFIVIKAQEIPATNGEATAGVTTTAQPITLLLDAGHGGSAAGALSADRSIAEKDLNLLLVKKIEALAPEYGIQTVLTRTEDVDVNHVDRIAKAHAVPHDMLLSIHMDAEAPVTGKGGIEAYISRNENALRPAATTLATALLSGLNQVYPAAKTVKTRQSEGIYILDKAVKPAVLLECGYITNPKDLAFILDPANQDKLARGILEAIAAYGLTLKNLSSGNLPKVQDSLPRQEGESIVRTFTRPAKKSPAAAEWASWKDSKIYGVWLDDKKIANETLNNYNPGQIAWYNVSKLSKNAINYGKHYYQVNLVTPAYYQKIFPKEKYEVKLAPATYKNKPGAILRDSLKYHIMRQLNRNLHYPEQALQQNRITTVHFTMLVDANGQLSDLQFQDKTVPGLPLLGITVTSLTREIETAVGPAEGSIRQLFLDEVTRAVGKYQAPPGWNDPRSAGRVQFVIQYLLEETEAYKKRQHQ